MLLFVVYWWVSKLCEQFQWLVCHLIVLFFCCWHFLLPIGGRNLSPNTFFCLQLLFLTSHAFFMVRNLAGHMLPNTHNILYRICVPYFFSGLTVWKFILWFSIFEILSKNVNPLKFQNSIRDLTLMALERSVLQKKYILSAL